MLANARHHRGAVEFDNRERGFYPGLPLLEILLGLGALLDVFGGVLEGDDLATTGQGNGIVELRFQPVALSASRPPTPPANVLRSGGGTIRSDGEGRSHATKRNPREHRSRT